MPWLPLFLLLLAGFAPLFAQAPAVDSLRLFRVDSVEIRIRDAFDDAPVHSPADAWVYSVGNVLHLETRESVVRKLLLFQKGDSVSLYQLIESERVLRNQKYISEARIVRRVAPGGENILTVTTNDNWTTTIPLALNKPGDEWVWQAGLLENNFLGLGQSIGFFFAHNETRDQQFFQYKNGHFIQPNNTLQAVWSENSDGYSRSFSMAYPFLSRSRNQWAYTLEGLTEKRDDIYYWSGEQIPGMNLLTNYSGAVTENDGTVSNRVMQVRGLREDSLSVRLARSFGNGFKSYVRASWDWHRLGYGHDYAVGRYAFSQNDNTYALDSAMADTGWVPELGDSRLGLAVTFSRIRYDRLVNFRHVKWTEDVDRGYTVQFAAARNVEALGAQDSRWRLGYDFYLALGGRNHHLTLRSMSDFYVDAGEREDIYAKLYGEYMFKPSNMFSTVLDGLMDTWQDAPYGQQLTLGGVAGLPGFPTAILAGQSRFLFRLEQRVFPGWEFGTVVPVFAAFADAGQVQKSLHAFEPDDMQYVMGLGVRLALSKSVYGVVNHLNVSWPVNGPLRDGAVPRVSLVGLLSL
jgi:hypothetical protein